MKGVFEGVIGGWSQVRGALLFVSSLGCSLLPVFFCEPGAGLDQVFLYLGFVQFVISIVTAPLNSLLLSDEYRREFDGSRVLGMMAAIAGLTAAAWLVIGFLWCGLFLRVQMNSGLFLASVVLVYLGVLETFFAQWSMVASGSGGYDGFVRNQFLANFAQAMLFLIFLGQLGPLAMFVGSLGRLVVLLGFPPSGPLSAAFLQFFSSPARSLVDARGFYRSSWRMLSVNAVLKSDILIERTVAAGLAAGQLSFLAIYRQLVSSCNLMLGRVVYDQQLIRLAASTTPASDYTHGRAPRLLISAASYCGAVVAMFFVFRVARSPLWLSVDLAALILGAGVVILANEGVLLNAVFSRAGERWRPLKMGLVSFLLILPVRLLLAEGLELKGILLGASGHYLLSYLVISGAFRRTAGKG